MAVGAVRLSLAIGDVRKDPSRRDRSLIRDQQWLLAALPAFPLVLLVLRLWDFSLQDPSTMLLLVQYVSPLGLIAALLITLVWMVPAGILIIQVLGSLLWASSADETEAKRSWLTLVSLRMPNWVIVLSAALALLTWQLRFVPALLMLCVAIVGLRVRDRHQAFRGRVQFACLILPLVAAAGMYAWMYPAIGEAFARHEPLTGWVLLLPPALAVLLTGPVPARAARLVTHWVAVVAAPLAPLLVGAVFLQAPILPTVAVEYDPSPDDLAGRTVIRGHVITTDDRMTTLLDADGAVHFILNDHLVSKKLCPDTDRTPISAVTVRGWPVELSAVEWLADSGTPAELAGAGARAARVGAGAPAVPTDPRCLGRPRHPDTPEVTPPWTPPPSPSPSPTVPSSPSANPSPAVN